jgi:hypothetical protein
MATYMADVEWKPLPTPMWPEGSVGADLHGLILAASFEQGVPSWKVQRNNGKNALPDLVSSGTADTFEAAKAAALHVAASRNDRLTEARGAFHTIGETLGGCQLARKVTGISDALGRDRAN